ncbi:hypothetical protein [Bacillus infantis]|uniref:Uncharacterized protein n=1 Tax=Bacillus infantis TaxID=324767 RepID=A0A5D4RGU6_9BACI|nr:hypothetical protein [Bacillus infantis]TYS50080.1 hypothetical protein FZD51_05870 [Bacillus infantis]
MPDLRNHGGIFGGGKPKGMPITQFNEAIALPRVASVPSSASYFKVLMDDAGGDFVYVVSDYSNNMCSLKVFRVSNMELVKELSINTSYSFVTNVYWVGDKLFITAYSSNFNDSWQYTFVYSTSSWGLLTQLSFSMIQVLHYDGTYIYGLTKSKYDSFMKFQRFRRSDYAVTDVFSRTNVDFKVIYQAKILIWKDKYSPYSTGAIRFDGAAASTPASQAYDLTYPVKNDTGKYVYGFYTYGSDYKHTFVYYFNKSDMSLIKSEQLSPDGGQWDAYSQSTGVQFFHIQKDGKYAYFSLGTQDTNGLYSQELDNGFFKFGKQTFDSGNTVKRLDVAPISPAKVVGNADVFIAPNFNERNVYKLINYLTIK